MNQLLHKRQEAIIASIEKRNIALISEIISDIKAIGFRVAKITINRDISRLLKENYIKKQRQGPATSYTLSPQYQLVKPYNIEKYFSNPPDKRNASTQFNFDIFSVLSNPFTQAEQNNLQHLNEQYKKNLTQLSSILLQKEYQRLTIELSWKSSHIEGNTYTLLETEKLLLQHKESDAHSKKEAIMILNHKKTLDYIRKSPKSFKRITTSKIELMHSIIVHSLGISEHIRKQIVRITGTAYTPINNQHQIREALEKTCAIINKEKNVFAKVLLMMLLVAYIQPFEDGNKRTSRMVGNALLLAYNACPISFRSIDEQEYKKAMLLFYEQNNLVYFKQLFIEQFEFAVSNYFSV